MIIKKLKILLLTFSLLSVFPDVTQAGVYYIKGESGNIYPFKIKGTIPSKTELQRIQNYLLGIGDSLPYVVPDFNPIECPWRGRDLTCKKYDLSVFDKCVEKKYRSLSGLDKAASISARESIDRNCYRKALNPSFFDKIFK